MDTKNGNAEIWVEISNPISNIPIKAPRPPPSAVLYTPRLSMKKEAAVSGGLREGRDDMSNAAVAYIGLESERGPDREFVVWELARTTPPAVGGEPREYHVVEAARLS